MEAITSFQGEYRFLSNFWPCHIVRDGLVYPSLEHAYAASKTDDPLCKNDDPVMFNARGCQRMAG